MAHLQGSKILLSVEETLQALSLGRTKLMELTYEGSIPSVKIGKRRLYPLDQVTKWARDQVTGGVLEAVNIDDAEVPTQPNPRRLRRRRIAGRCSSGIRT
jgi:excisionase family DNA binding protein